MRVLIAEDEDTSAMLVGKMLTDAGFEATRVRDGEQALQRLLTGESYDVILTDWLMPNMDGIALIRELRRRDTRPPPIVVLTAIASDSARYRVLDAGADDYLAKPANQNELVQCLERAVARTQQSPQKTELMHAEPAPSSAPIHHFPLVMLTAGAGGPNTLQHIFETMGQAEKAVFIVVQHGPNWMLETFAHRLQAKTELNVRMASNAKILKAGEVLIAPGGRHTTLADGGLRLVCTPAQNADINAPSADLLFESAARQLPGECLGVILTGSGCDGARGAQALRCAGATVIVQHPASADVQAMPRGAIALSSSDTSLDASTLEIAEMDDIPPRLDEYIFDTSLRLGLASDESRYRHG